ncbi:hypothetical protein J3R30DRAFT_3449017, partial [Lentinula aciculospora]
MCYTGYGTYFIFPISPSSFIFVTIWIHLHSSISFYIVPHSSITFQILLSTFRTVAYSS